MASSIFNTPKTPTERAQYYIQISSKYTHSGFDRIKRHCEYCVSPGSITSTRAAGTAIVAAAVVFGKAGQKIGKSIQKLVAVDKTDGDLGGFIGGGTGLILGTCAGGYAYMKFIEHSEHYQGWLNMKLEHAVKAATTYSYSNDPILENYCCPLTLCIMDIPAFSPSGTLYDLDCLSNLPKDGRNKIKDPLNNPSFKEDEIKQHWEMGFLIKKRLQFLIKKDLEQVKNPENLKESLESQLEHINKATVIHYEYARKDVDDRRKNKVTSPQEYKKEMEEFEKLFGVDENQELDWSLDWEATLKERFKFFNPTAIILR